MASAASFWLPRGNFASANMKTKVYPVRLTEEERKELEKRAKKIGLTVVAYIRMKTLYEPEEKKGKSSAIGATPSRDAGSSTSGLPLPFRKDWGEGKWKREKKSRKIAAFISGGRSGG
jgi:hypothetical protein